MFRFTIRDLLWLIAVVAVGVAWIADRAQYASKSTLILDHATILRGLNAGDRVIIELRPDGNINRSVIRAKDLSR